MNYENGGEKRGGMDRIIERMSSVKILPNLKKLTRSYHYEKH